MGCCKDAVKLKVTCNVWNFLASWATMRDLKLLPRCKWDTGSSSMLRSVLLVTYRRFGTICLSHFQESSRPLKTTSIGCPENLVANYQSAVRNIPEERRSNRATISFKRGTLLCEFKSHCWLLRRCSPCKVLYRHVCWASRFWHSMTPTCTLLVV